MFRISLLLGLAAFLFASSCDRQKPFHLPEQHLETQAGEASQLNLALPEGFGGVEVRLLGAEGLVVKGWGGPRRIGYWVDLELEEPGSLGLVLWVGEEVPPGTYSLRLSLIRGNKELGGGPLRLTVTEPVRNPGADWRPLAPSLYRVVFQGGLFLALGDEGTLLASPDGRKWTARTVPTRAKLFGAAWGGRWVAVGQDGVLLVSEDGKGWRPAPLPTADWLYGVAHGGGRFVAGGTGPFLWASEDGLRWRPLPLPDPGLTLQGLVWGPGGFVAVGLGGVALRSPDGLTWERVATGVSQHLRDVAHTPLGYVAVGDGGTVLLSPDGRGWRSYGAAEEDLVGVAFGEGVLLVVGAGGGVYTSAEGTTWSPLAPLPTALSSVAYGHRRFVAVGYAGTILTAP